MVVTAVTHAAHTHTWAMSSRHGRSKTAVRDPPPQGITQIRLLSLPLPTQHLHATSHTWHFDPNDVQSHTFTMTIKVRTCWSPPGFMHCLPLYPSPLQAGHVMPSRTDTCLVRTRNIAKTVKSNSNTTHAQFTLAQFKTLCQACETCCKKAATQILKNKCCHSKIGPHMPIG